MRAQTEKLWAQQDRPPGDRARLFRAASDHVGAALVLYPGSYVDVAASFVWPSVTYADVDRRARRFFADTEGVDEIIAAHGVEPAEHTWQFVPGDYTTELLGDDASYDLLISLYAGLVSEHCTRYLRPGGALLVNASHGDVAMASLDARYTLEAVVLSVASGYVVSTADLDGHLVAKREVEVTRELIHRTGRGVAYTHSAAAYLFRLAP